MIFSSTLLTLSGHEKYVHGFHLPCGPNPQTPQAWWHEGIDCRESAAEATAGSSHPSRKRAPNLSPLDHFLLDLWTIFLDPRRIKRAALLVKPTTLLRCHQALIKWKYRLLYSSQKRGKPGPKGPSRQLIELVLEMKRRNPSSGCTKIAEQISKAFALPLDKDVVRRILTAYYRPERGEGPSWLSFIGHMKDSLWSIDFFRCESLRLQTHWDLVVMDQCTRRIIGFEVHPTPAMDGRALCCLFQQATSRKGLLQWLSSDHGPVFRFHQWQANLRILGIHEVKTLPCVPGSHPFIERLIGTIRREYLDHMVFWNESDLERKLEAFKEYDNGFRLHQSLHQQTPEEAAGQDPPLPADPVHFMWRAHGQGLFQTPLAA